MKNNFKLNFQKGDILAIVLVLALAVGTGLFFLPSAHASEEVMVQIWQDGAMVQELSLNEERSIEIAGDYHNVVTIQDGKVSISESDCPGEDCVHSGWIRSVGRSIVCLPNKVEVRLVGKQDDVDFVVR